MRPQLTLTLTLRNRQSKWTPIFEISELAHCVLGRRPTRLSCKWWWYLFLLHILVYLLTYLLTFKYFCTLTCLLSFKYFCLLTYSLAYLLLDTFTYLFTCPLAGVLLNTLLINAYLLTWRVLDIIQMRFRHIQIQDIQQKWLPYVDRFHNKNISAAKERNNDVSINEKKLK